jgi:hypothetical protein
VWFEGVYRTPEPGGTGHVSAGAASDTQNCQIRQGSSSASTTPLVTRPSGPTPSDAFASSFQSLCATYFLWRKDENALGFFQRSSHYHGDDLYRTHYSGLDPRRKLSQHLPEGGIFAATNTWTRATSGEASSTRTSRCRMTGAS